MHGRSHIRSIAAVAAGLVLWAAAGTSAAAGSARCTGAADCRACKSCASCVHCRSGGTCGTCRVAAEPSDGVRLSDPSNRTRRRPSTKPKPVPPPAAAPAPAEAAGPIRAVVVRVLDGDTVEVMRGASRVKVRLLGVDAPETSSAAFGKKELGLKATEFLKGEVLQRQVALEFDGPQLDRYGRTLAYMTRKSDGVLINRLIVEKGYAVAYTAYPFRLMAEFREAEREARRKGVGLWGPAGTVTGSR